MKIIGKSSNNQPAESVQTLRMHCCVFDCFEDEQDAKVLKCMLGMKEIAERKNNK